MSPDDATNQFLGAAAVADAVKQQDVKSGCHERHSCHPTPDAAASTGSVRQPDTGLDCNGPYSPNSTRNTTAIPPSAALLEANQHLLVAQAQAKKERLAKAGEQERVVSATRQSHGQPAVARGIEDHPFITDNVAPTGLVPEMLASTAAIIAALPEHLGWESATLSALRRGRRPAQTRQTTAHGVSEGSSFVTVTGVTDYEGKENPGCNEWISSGCLESRCVGGSSLNPYAKIAPELPEWIKLYPGLGVGLLRRNLTAPGRLWLFLRALDPSGQGRLPLKATRDAVVTATSPLRFCGVRQWRNLLQAGAGIFWTWDEENIWLKATAKVALALGVRRLTGQPVAFPVAALREGVGLFRAHLYAAFHSGRCQETVRGRQVMPIARATLAGLSGVGASSQRAYEKQTKLKVQANFAVGEIATEENRENRAWKQGQAVFELTDYRGQHGRKGETYLAWQLPNRYLGQHQHRPKGRQKRINRELKDLVMQGMPGNVGERVDAHPEKRYYPNGKEAVRVCGRRSNPDFYWQRYRLPNRSVGLWQQVTNG